LIGVAPSRISAAKIATTWLGLPRGGFGSAAARRSRVLGAGRQALAEMSIGFVELGTATSVTRIASGARGSESGISASSPRSIPRASAVESQEIIQGVCSRVISQPGSWCLPTGHPPVLGAASATTCPFSNRRHRSGNKFHQVQGMAAGDRGGIPCQQLAVRASIFRFAGDAGDVTAFGPG
jgi:hypothetical protein